MPEKGILQVSERRADVGADIGRGIRKLRKQKGWTQTELAKEANLSFPTISLIETGKTNPSIFDIEQIANALGTSLPGLLSASRRSLKLKDQDLIDYIGNALRTRRLELGLTKAELGQRADLLPQYISTTENCRRLVGLKNLVKLSEALEVDFSYFIPAEKLHVGKITHDTSELGPNLRKLRRKKGISISQLTASTGLTPPHIVGIESGKHNPRLNTLILFCTGLGVSISEVFSS